MELAAGDRGMRPFSPLRWFFLCFCGLRHRRGETCHLTMKGAPPRKLSLCTRCGVKGKGLAH